MEINIREYYVTVYGNCSNINFYAKFYIKLIIYVMEQNLQCRGVNEVQKNVKAGKIFSAKIT